LNSRVKQMLGASAAAAALAAAWLCAPAQADVVVATASACSLQTSATGSDTATPFIMNYTEYSDTTDYPGIKTAIPASMAYLLVGPTEFSSDSIITGTTPVAYYKSYQAFYNSLYGLDSAPAIPSGYKWVAYDPEDWAATPGTPTTGNTGSVLTGGAGEMGDPTAAEAGFIQLAHEFGYKVIVTPSQDLTTQPVGETVVNEILDDSWAQELTSPITAGAGDPAAPWPNEAGQTIPQSAGLADIYEVQNQAYEASTYEFNDFPGSTENYFVYYSDKAAQQAQAVAAAAGGSLDVFDGVSDDRITYPPTSPYTAGGELQYGFNTANSVDYPSTTTPEVDGYWLNLPSTSSGDISAATSFLSLIDESTATACSLDFASNYEGANTAVSTLASGATTTACTGCSDGYRVEDIGGTNYGTDTFSGISALTSGSYTMVVSYISVGGAKTAYISVNGGTPQSVSFPETSPTDYNVVGTYDVTVSLTAGGSNTVEFAGNGDGVHFAPSLDRIVVED